MAIAAAPAAASLFAGFGSVSAGAATSGAFLGLSAGTYAAIASGASGVLAVMQGIGGYNAAKGEKQRLAMQRTAGQIEAARQSNQRTSALLDTIASRNAAFGARNVALGLGTPQALDFNDYANYNESERIGALNTATDYSDATSQMKAADIRSRNSLYSGILGVTQSAATFGQGLARIGSVPQTPAQASGNIRTGG